MIAVLDELSLTELATSITGLSALGAAAILAETGARCLSPPDRAKRLIKLAVGASPTLH